MGGFNNVIFSRNHYIPHYSTPYRIERVTILLKDKETNATIYPIFSFKDIPLNLLSFLTQEYNDEIARGDTQPFFDPLTQDEFRDYWFGQFAAVMIIGDSPNLSNEYSINDWATKCLGFMFIKSSYPGRSSHVCTANFLVNAGIRRKGIGFLLCECFLRWAPRLGYSYCVVELVFDTNVAAKKVFEKCGFKKIGRIKGCGMLKSTKDLLIDALTFGRDLVIVFDDPINSKHTNILKYLISGQYPDGASREEKSRLRALAYHYKVQNGKLFLKGKEVIFSPQEQLRIAQLIHERDHLGINRTTTLICEKYYWTKIKLTVAKIVKDCLHCKETTHSDHKNKSILKRNIDKTDAEIQPTLHRQRQLQLQSQLVANSQTQTQIENQNQQPQTQTPEDLLLHNTDSNQELIGMNLNMNLNLNLNINTEYSNENETENNPHGYVTELNHLPGGFPNDYEEIYHNNDTDYNIGLDARIPDDVADIMNNKQKKVVGNSRAIKSQNHSERLPKRYTSYEGSSQRTNPDINSLISQYHYDGQQHNTEDLATKRQTKVNDNEALERNKKRPKLNDHVLEPSIPQDSPRNFNYQYRDKSLVSRLSSRQQKLFQNREIWRNETDEPHIDTKNDSNIEDDEGEDDDKEREKEEEEDDEDDEDDDNDDDNDEDDDGQRGDSNDEVDLSGVILGTHTGNIE